MAQIETGKIVIDGSSFEDLEATEATEPFGGNWVAQLARSVPHHPWIVGPSAVVIISCFGNDPGVNLAAIIGVTVMTTMFL